MFKKGQSGNPKGRPVGETPQGRMRRQVEERLPEMTEMAIAQALAGDATMFKILLDKTLPSIRPVALPVNIQQGDSLTETSANVITETFTGKIAPDIGAMLITALSNQAKILEVNELAARIEELEKIYGNSNSQKR